MNKQTRKETVESTVAVVVWVAICFAVISVFGSCSTLKQRDAQL